jgi:hypothetical protein
MVVDSLITDADAARERGRAILGDTGQQALMTLDMPLRPDPGLITPGRLLAVEDERKPWRGLVRACAITADWGDSLSVRQTLEVERHYL